jgi:hypothetical protein
LTASHERLRRKTVRTLSALPPSATKHKCTNSSSSCGKRPSTWSGRNKRPRERGRMRSRSCGCGRSTHPSMPSSTWRPGR